MIDEKILLDIVHDFSGSENYEFSIIEFKEFEDRNEKILWLNLKLEKFRFVEGKNLQIIKSDIKKRMSNLLGLDRVILFFGIESPI